jgi:FlaA1/EpsC-like NDP-sugar epimerase
VRLMGDRRIMSRLAKGSANGTMTHRRALIVGAGDAGAIIVREMQNSAHLDVEPVGFVDDDPSKHNMRLLGVPVLGTIEGLPKLVGDFQISEVVVAMPTAPGAVIREVKRLCQQANVPCKVLPGIYELINGRVSVGQLRPVQIDDLLRRDPVEIDRAALGQYLSGMRILVTGAGGSIGSELCRQIARYDPLQLVLLGHGENSIYGIERELRSRYPNLDLVACIADVRDLQRLDVVFSRYRPNVVFHAAAHKHVPLMECNVDEAVTNNVLGTQCALSASVKYGVGRFVLVSTDKAVNPRSVMGASKRVAEMMVQDAAQRAAGVLVAVRFGNVLGSRGSVVPLFQEQIAAGGPMTITDPGMERFFMTIPEAVNLVLQAGALGRSGAIYMLDMGEPVRIVDLARDMVELSGLHPDDIEVKFIGARPGEKIREELSTLDEDTSPTSHPCIKMLRGVLTLDSRRLDEAVQELVSIAKNGGEHETRVRLMELATINGRLEAGGSASRSSETSLADAPATTRQDSQRLGSKGARHANSRDQ